MTHANDSTNASLTSAAERSEKKGRRIDWYRTPLEGDTLKRLSQRSDFMGFAQTLGYLGLYAATVSGAIYSFVHWHWSLTVLIVFLHGTITAFMINGVHELGHNTVFRTKWLNEFFVRVLSFLGWINFQWFNTSHSRHHAYTLHPPDDSEVVLPLKPMLIHCVKFGIINPHAWKWTIREAWRLARGKFQGDWETKILFPPDAPQRSEPVIRWARFLLLAHALVFVTSLALAWFVSPAFLLLIVTVNLGPWYGMWLHWLCNNTQHVGLQDNVADFRLNCRTFTLNPIPQFLYWHMNYHIEHHMYPTVPCYNLGKLHRAIKHDLAPCPDGLVEVWQEITAILEKQAVDPTYQHHAPVPQHEQSGATTQPA